MSGESTTSESKPKRDQKTATKSKRKVPPKRDKKKLQLVRPFPDVRVEAEGRAFIQDGMARRRPHHKYRTKLTAEIIYAIGYEMRRGLTIEAACWKHGIRRDDYERWIEEAARSDKGIYVDFIQEIERNTASFAEEIISRIVLANNPSVLLQLLERLLPEQYKATPPDDPAKDDGKKFELIIKLGNTNVQPVNSGAGVGTTGDKGQELGNAG